MKTISARLGCVLILGVLLGACGSPTLRGTVIDPPFEAPDFVLTDQYGQPFQLSDQRGSVVLLFFGYTNCPDVCPTTLAIWRETYEALGEDANQVRFVYVTVDPERDTQERLATYLNAFSPDFFGLSGTADELDAVYKSYGVFHEKQPSPGGGDDYEVAHTSTAVVIDPEGQWRVNEPYGTPAEDLVNDIQALLK